ncbi:transport and Golgi organization 2 homolog [Hydractinia symbiolongicarpus]|uniref:transport and Golgi organization 2 homolog n=1 Tax=Hydractinia symbiolongicarpus TaxID=13093 RepID=UPI002549D0C6|nr:transport and Golgi organization 2 homolog [Hydractinia symbiolongicarpus]
MCIIFLWRQEDNRELLCNYKFILAANRDEWLYRPTKPAHFWTEEPNVIGGLDQLVGYEGGTWLGMTKTGKFGCLTNIHNNNTITTAKGYARGMLVSTYLKSKVDTNTYVNSIQDVKFKYKPFNLILGNILGDMMYLNNVNQQAPVVLKPGYNCIGNSVMGYQNLKETKGKQNFETAIKKSTSKETLMENLLACLDDSPRHIPEASIKECNQENEYLSSVFMPETFIPEFGICGTRTNTIILVDKYNHVTFFERTMTNPQQRNNGWHTSIYEFEIAALHTCIF